MRRYKILTAIDSLLPVRWRLTGWWGAMGALWLLLVASEANAARKIRFTNASEKTTPIQDKELALRKVTTSRYTESWSLWAWDDKGWSVFGVFLVSRVHPFVGTRVGVQLSLYSPQGRVYHKLQEFKVHHLKASQQTLSMKISDHSLHSTLEKGRLQMNWDGLGADLRFSSVLAAFRQYDGPVRLGRNRFIGVSFGPRLQVTGTLQVKGQKVAFSGRGFAERSWQNVPHEMAKRWFNLRAMNKDYTLAATDWKPLREWRPRNLSTLSIAYKKRWILHAKATKVQFAVRQKQRDKASGYRVPRYVRYQAKLPDGGNVNVVVRFTRELHRLDVLSHVPAWLRTLVQRLITKPFLFRHKVVAELTIIRGNQVKKVALPGLSEWVFLNP